ncbi:hypothetical protein [Micromonospora sp. CB01531]|uniref:hypothetical protein n=1 Tax=Micromonospora sp. CB01531 TaxID=1718947 RepID=UPI00093982AC|nr:hypothetical protein [Micromonospora sp. CB01531]OKI47288.1 hypothetical protein A6A27_10600 [Micromonospora sp. CB01531]
MTQPAYTDADVDQLHETFAKAWTLHLGQHSGQHSALAGCNSELNTEDCCDREGLRAVLAHLADAGRLTTNGRCGDIAPNLSLIASHIRQVCCLTAGHAGWHRGDDGSEWVEHNEEPA